MHRLLILLLAGLLLPLAAATVTLTVDKAHPVIGDEIQVTVVLTGSTAFRTWGTAVEFPAGSVQYLGAAAGSIPTFVGDARGAAAIQASGEVHTGGYHPALNTDNAGGDGTLVVLRFRVTGGGTLTFRCPARSAAKPFGTVLTAVDGSTQVPADAAPLTVGARAPDQVWFDTASAAPAEPATAGWLRLRRNDTTEALTVPLVYAGTASAGTDYQAPAASATFAAGAATVDLPIVPLDDSALEGGETVVCTIQPGPRHALGNPASATIILADDEAPVLRLVPDRTAVVVGDSVVVDLVLDRAPAFAQWGTVLVFPVNGFDPVAQAGGGLGTFVPDARTLAAIDASGEVRSGGYDGAASAGPVSLGRITLRATTAGTHTLSTRVRQPGDAFGCALIDAGGNAILPALAGSVAVTVTTPPQVSLEAIGLAAAERGTVAPSFRVRRNQTVGALTVDLGWSGTAGALRWTARPDTVAFSDGQATATVTLTPVDDTAIQGPQSTTVSVADRPAYDPTGSPLTITLADDDGAYLSMAADRSEVPVGGTVTVTIRLDQAPGFRDWGVALTYPTAGFTPGAMVAGEVGTFVPDARPTALIDPSGEVRLGGYGSATSAGVLATVTLTVDQAGTHTLRLPRRDLGAPFGAVLIAPDFSQQIPNVAGDVVITAYTNQPPSAPTLSPATVAENRPAGTVVGTLAASDPNGAADTLTFSLVAGTGDSDNARFTIAGTQLLTAASFDYEQAATRSIRVCATDRAGATAAAVRTVTITDAPDRLYVRPSATGAATGLSWTNAFTDLAPALAAAQPGMEVWVAAGTYQPTAGSDQAATLALRPRVTVLGGFAGSETAASARDWVVNRTVLSGDLGVAGSTGDNSNQVVTLDAGAELAGVLVAQGLLADLGITGLGGATAASLHEVVVHGGAADGVVAAGPVALLNVLVAGNAGTGLRLSGPDQSVRSCTVVGNGTGILCSAGATATVVNSVIAANTVAGLVGSGATVDLHHSAVRTAELTGVTAGAGMVTGDPGLANAASPAGADGIFLTFDDGARPTFASALISAAEVATSPAVDLGNRARPSGAGPEIGAFEATSGPGDLNGDGVVNVSDLSLVTAHFGQSTSDTAWDARADANGDGVVNVADLTRVTSNFGRSYQ